MIAFCLLFCTWLSPRTDMSLVQTMRVPDLAEELPFWTAGLGMKVLQSSAGVAVLGYGPEGKGTSAGGQFAIQLVEEGEEDSIKAPAGALPAAHSRPTPACRAPECHCADRGT